MLHVVFHVEILIKITNQHDYTRKNQTFKAQKLYGRSISRPTCTCSMKEYNKKKNEL